MIAALVLFTGTARAEIIFSNDFQDGQADGWAAAGDGDVRLTTYAGNVSMRLTKQAAALTVFSTRGFEGVSIVVEFAADSLERKDACIAEASIDGGRSWIELFRVTDGQDDGVTLHRGGKTAPRLDDRKQVILRVRAAGNRRDDICWFDNPRVTGFRRHAAARGTRGTRRVLTADFLLGDARLSAPVDYSAYAPPADRAAPTHRLLGRLKFAVEPDRAGFEILRDDFGYRKASDSSYRMPPPFDFAFVQTGDRLAPVRRGVVVSNSPYWDWIVEPGYVWNEPGDGDWTRAAIPFSLQERNANCTHNGVLTFLFAEGGKVSRVAYQMTQETCLYFKFNAWGTAPATYVPQEVADADAIGRALARELARRLPTRPIEKLSEDHPELDPASFGSPLEVDPQHMTVFGVVIDGIHYVGGCQTRSGRYPFCDELDLPSYSTAKTIFAGLALMRLEWLYPGTKNALVTDYVPECAAARGWDGVTFDHLLDMATGRYRSAKDQKDEESLTSHPFFLVPTHGEKIRIACRYFPRKAKPGRIWVYHTSDTYILGTAMSAFWRRKMGSDADLYRDLVVGQIWAPLGLSPTLHETRRTYDDVAQPFTGWGLTYLRDDIAKLGRFMVAGSGAANGQQLVSARELKAALQRLPADTGVRAASDDLRYNNGVWAWNIQHFMGCKTPTWIPFMSGYGGIIVVLLPNGTVYYYVSDNGEYRWAHAAAELDKYQPFCRR